MPRPSHTDPVALAPALAAPSPPALPSTTIRNRIGTTARSCASSTAKMLRPAIVASRFCSASSCSTIAVEDSARQAPITRLASTVLPKASAMPLIAVVVSTTCDMPSPNTSRRIVQSRSNDSSSPMVNSRKATPSSASRSTASCEVMVIACSHGKPSPMRPRL